MKFNTNASRSYIRRTGPGNIGSTGDGTTSIKVLFVEILGIDNVEYNRFLMVLVDTTFKMYIW